MQSIGLKQVRPAVLVIAPVAVLTLISATILAMLVGRAGPDSDSAALILLIGGAAYAIAIGSKPRRDATVSLVTYRDGRPVGLQWVTLSPLGDLSVSRWKRLAG